MRIQKHPSGKPRREEEYRRLPIMRPPRDSYLTPGLRDRGGKVEAIGFHTQFLSNIPEDEEDHA